MDAVNQLLLSFASVWERVLEMPAHMLLVLVLNVLGFALKKSPLRNDLIPWILIALGAMAYPLLASPAAVNPSLKNPYVVLVMHGFLLGVAAVVLHAFILKRLAPIVPLWLRELMGIEITP